MNVLCNIEARSRNYFCRGKVISIIYSESVSVALVIQHAKRMRHIILSSVPYFSTLSHKRRDFRDKVMEHKMCVLTFKQPLSETLLILRRIKRYIIINLLRSSCKMCCIGR
jgi:predicted transcriptional regulator